MFQPKGSLLEIVLRVTLVYVFLLILLRVSGKKEFAQLEPMDLLVMLILSETVSPALTNNDTSLTAGFVAAGTLIGLTVLTSYVTFRFRKAEKLIHGQTSILIKDGKLDEEVLRKERMTDQQLHTVLHKEGIKAVQDVKRAFIEPSGDITIIKREPEPS